VSEDKCGVVMFARATLLDGASSSIAGVLFHPLCDFRQIVFDEFSEALGRVSLVECMENPAEEYETFVFFCQGMDEAVDKFVDFTDCIGRCSLPFSGPFPFSRSLAHGLSGPQMSLLLQSTA
jgi:hypothetical protein